MKRKEYEKIRNNFSELNEFEFSYVLENYKRLKFQYRCLQICNKLEKINIHKSEVFLLKFFFKLVDFIRWKFYDLFYLLIIGKKFNLYGVTCFCGRQGDGKTIGIVETLERIRNKFPDCIICTNINYANQDISLTSWLQLLTLRNGENGVVFVIDEVQNNGLDWSKFPSTLLQVVTMQRKNKIKIYLSSQVYKSVVIQLRRQCFEVVECRTFFGRWSIQKYYDAEEYNNIIDIATPEKRMRLHKKFRYSYIQSNYLRSLYDTNQIVYTLLDFDKLNSEEVKQELFQLKNKKTNYLISSGFFNFNK